MTYAFLSDELLLNLEHAGVSRDARLLYIEGLVHCTTVPTDGDIRVRLGRLSDAPDPDALAGELIESGLWRREAYGYRIEHYLKSEGGHQRSREQVLNDQAANRRRQENYRRKVAENKGRNAVTNGVSNAAHPTPSHPDPKGGGDGDGSGVALARSASPSRAREPHGFDDPELDEDGVCAVCGQGNGDQRHAYRPDEALRIAAAFTQAGAHIYDLYFSDDRTDPGGWSLSVEFPEDLFVHVYTVGDPFTFGRVHHVTTVFKGDQEDVDAIMAALPKHDTLQCRVHHNGVVNVGAQSETADVRDLLPVIVQAVRRHLAARAVAA